MAERSDVGGGAVSGVSARATPRLPAGLLRVSGRLLRRLGGFGFGRWIGLTLFAVLLAVRVWDPAPVELVRLKLFDLYQNIEPRAYTPQPVAIVDLDEESIQSIGQWPWSRLVMARLVEQIAAYGAAVIAFDIVFPEPDRLSPGAIADDLEALDEATRERLRALPSNDERLAEAIARGRVVLGLSGFQRQVGDSYDPPKPAPLAKIGGDPTPFLFRYPGAVRNLEVLEEAAMGQALFSLVPEWDGIVRRVPAMAVVQDRILPTLSLEALRVATGQEAFAIKRDQAGISSIVVAGLEIPTDRNGLIWVNYTPTRAERFVSARDILWGRAPRDSLAGKIVFVGTSAVGLQDIKPTPIDPAVPGVEVHAQLLETVLTRSYLTRPHYAIGLELLMTAAVGLLMIVVVPIMGALPALLFGGTVALTLAGVSWQLYNSNQLLIDVGYPLVASLAVYGALVYFNYFREESERRQVRSAFSQYLSPALVEQLAEHPERLALGGETREMTVLFSDVRGFTTVSEHYKSNPQGLTSLMNSFLTPLSNDILEGGGTIDKYMGDAIMAFWNAPLPDAAHAEHACAVALAMQDSLARVNRQRRELSAISNERHFELRIGIGIDTGECVVGNMGSDQRFDYTVMGDTVNVASRLEGQTKVYGVGIAVGAPTVERLKSPFALLEIDLIRVKGKLEPERVYTLLGDATEAGSDDFRDLERRHEAMLAAYRAQDWPEALALVGQCRSAPAARRHDLSGLYDLYEARIMAFREAPPGPDWDGVFVASEK